jgi:hypothetical protein
MVMLSQTYKAACCVLSLALAAGAQAQETIQPLVLNAKYTIAWSGIPLGRILIEAHEDGASYRMSIDTKTKGIGALVSDEARVVSAQGTKASDGSYIPSRYHSRPHRKGGDDLTTLTYDAKGDIVKRERVPEDDPAWRPPVPFAEVNTARDPITAAFILRRKLYEAMADKKAEIGMRTYDGRRLAEMKLIRTSDARVAVMDKYYESVNVGITRTPINGYTPKELKKFKKGDPAIHLFFTKDSAFLPIRATAKTPVGELSMTLSEKY